MQRLFASTCIRRKLFQKCSLAWNGSDPHLALGRQYLRDCLTSAWISSLRDIKTTTRGPCLSRNIEHGSRSGLRYITTTRGKSCSSRNKGSEGRSGRLRWSGILLFIPGLSAFGLGTWQIMRRKWKMELLDHRRERLKDDLVPLDLAITSVGSASGDVLQHLEYKRVQCEGDFAEGKSIYLGPRGRTNHGVTERGYFLITPLVPAEPDYQSVQVPVLVNRGWVPGSWRDNPPRNEVESNGESLASYDKTAAKKGLFVSLWGRKQQDTSLQKEPQKKATSVVGVIRGSENPNMFVPPNEPAKGQWFFVDVPAMARAVGLPENTIYVEALQDKAANFKRNQYPDPKDPEMLIRSSVMPQDHLSYAFTWYTLSAATSFMAWKRLLK